VGAAEPAQRAAGEEASGGPRRVPQAPAVGQAPGTGPIQRPDQQPPAGPGDAGQFGHHPGGVVDELQQRQRHGEVEGAGGKRQPVRVGDQPRAAVVGGGDDEHAGVEVDADHHGSCLFECTGEAAGATADVQDPRPVQGPGAAEHGGGLDREGVAAPWRLEPGVVVGCGGRRPSGRRCRLVGCRRG
jgi:hypothetical protein